MRITLPVGNYIISDACYVMDNSSVSDQNRKDLQFYAQALGKTSWGNLMEDPNRDILLGKSGEVKFDDGTVGVYLPTAYGDGIYELIGDLTDEVWADAGNVSVIPISQCDEIHNEGVAKFSLKTFPATLTLLERGVWTIQSLEFFVQLDTTGHYEELI